MKKPLLILPLLLVPLLTSCQKEKVTLTYGTYTQNTIYSIKELTTSELLAKAKDDQEVFLLAVYQDEYSEGCLCWQTFENVIATYMNNIHEVVYAYNAYNQSDAIKHLKIEKMEESTPTLYIFNGEKTVAKFSYRNNQDMAIFEDTTGEAMFTRVHKYIERPKMYYVDEAYLDECYSKKDLAILFMRNKCGDCKYVLPNVIIPYIKKHSLATDLYLFDLQKIYDAARNEFATQEEKEAYQNLKDKYGLSEQGNATFGYQYGVVPTIQFIKNGVIDGASVYFNDEVIKKEDGSYYLSNSYYSEERLANLKYLANASFTTVLKGMGIKEGIMENKNGGYYWSQEEASKYHKPILEAFLDYYMR